MTAALAVAERIPEARDKLALLEREGGVAMLDGKPFDLTRLAAASAEIVVLEAAESEARSRERAEADRLAGIERAKCRKRAEKAVKRYGEALTKGETAAKALVVEIRALQAEAEDLRSAAIGMGATVPLPLLGPELVRTISRLIAGELVGLSGRSHFGDLTFPSVPTPDWTGHFTKYVEPLFAETPTEDEPHVEH